jgi:formylglycine-generating enzyme required for sulfatase activity
MPVLFVSHASKDDAIADDLGGWLKANGFSDVFIDQKSIAAGAKWDEALQRAAGACRVVLLLLTPHWLDSAECYGEFKAAWYMGKRILPLFVMLAGQELGAEEIKRFQSVCREDQGLDITGCLGEGGCLNLDAVPEIAERLKAGLRAAGAMNRVGLDPEAFAIDTVLRPTPFPGLASFGDEDADAALFYGRSREIAQTLEELRAVRAKRDPRPFVILGASGAGKSSLLKAGIIPRLRRERLAWLPLRAFRPGADPLLNFAEAIARTLADFGRREANGLIRDRLFEVWERMGGDVKGELAGAGHAALETSLEAEGARLRKAANLADATILISVDQAEEMARADGASAEALADYLRVALASAKSPWQLAFSIRTDSFPELQSHRRFQNLEARGYDLRALPVFRFDSVVEEPAKRYDVAVEPDLVYALMEDAPKEDALPLLAFALQRLWRQYAASGALTKAHYEKVGGLQGFIEDAAERAMRGLEPGDDAPLPSAPPPKRQTDLAAATFVPALVEINDQGATIRHIADWFRFPAEQQELLNRFDRWRLVVRRGEAEGGTVEVAHEALFRTWKRLESWLEPERARLEALRNLQVDAGNWERAAKNDGFLNHRNQRLADARNLSMDERYAARLASQDFAYLDACRAAERAARARARRSKMLVGALAFLLIALGAGWWRQNWLLDQYQWRWVMGGKALTKAEEIDYAAHPGRTFKECAEGCPEMVVIRAGKFLMGSPESEKGRNSYEGPQHEVLIYEGPQHEVSIAKPFAVGKFTVKFTEWDACTAAGACAKANDDGWGRGNRPVIYVSWDDAKQYAAWLSRVSGKTYRLLSEAEWEYAARAGTSTAYYWGDEIGKGNANCSECGSEWDGKQTAPAGSFKSNAFGLHDMAGNVSQWVEDCASYQQASSDGSANTTVYCGQRVIRGGSWSDSPQDLRSAYRSSVDLDNRVSVIGFRVARTLNP